MPSRSVTGTNSPRGVVHENSRHTTRFTVVGNHLAQHGELSLTAIGLAVHIQSLQAGARVDIKSLTARFPEGAHRVAGALRELEAHGYLRRERLRTPAGRVVTRTISCNQPRAVRTPAPTSAEPDRPPPPSPPRRRPPAPLRVPHPAFPAGALLAAATELLAGLYRADVRLLLPARDVQRLAPGVAAWLEREVAPEAVRHALTANLPPEGVRRPAALLAHRLTALLPPEPPRPVPKPKPDPLHFCEPCDVAFRAPLPSDCPHCAKAVPHPSNDQKESDGQLAP
ncbi:helix-turn-helix domain-containing protein [Streptomyces sp. NPDC046887]|uniref:helix-turn-helix domain-containing protein n=1 Tax=Streptomyces sp. NPDC046887 TaxID=3155472 RepID=UPI0033FD0725